MLTCPEAGTWMAASRRSRLSRPRGSTSGKVSGQCPWTTRLPGSSCSMTSSPGRTRGKPVSIIYSAGHVTATNATLLMGFSGKFNLKYLFECFISNTNICCLIIACLFRCCCCFYYLFCCCICCEKSKVVTKQTFVKRFEKWLNLDKRAKKEATLLVAKTMMRMYAH